MQVTRRRWLGSAGVATLAGKLPAAPAPSDVAQRAIRTLKGKVVSPRDYPHTLEGFQRFLTDSGVRFFSAVELTRPNHPEVAARVGYREFLPSPDWWPRGAALALLADRLREVVGSPVKLRNWWRPEAYNRTPEVAGARSSDHLTAHSLDLDYSSADDQRKASVWLHDLMKREPWMKLSLGIGPTTTHVGIGSPRGSREWRYGAEASLRAASEPEAPSAEVRRKSATRGR